MGWTRQQAIDYMLAHTAEGARDAASEVDRYIIYPGQATSYMLGMLEIRRARDEAEQTMGSEVRHQSVPRSRARGRGGAAHFHVGESQAVGGVGSMIALKCQPRRDERSDRFQVREDVRIFAEARVVPGEPVPRLEPRHR